MRRPSNPFDNLFSVQPLLLMHGFDAMDPVAHLPQSKRLLEQVHKVPHYQTP